MLFGELYRFTYADLKIEALQSVFVWVHPALARVKGAVMVMARSTFLPWPYCIAVQLLIGTCWKILSSTGVVTWTPKVCRITAFYRYWAIIVPTFGGFR